MRSWRQSARRAFGGGYSEDDSLLEQLLTYLSQRHTSTRARLPSAGLRASLVGISSLRV
jgi:hypothetical protein